MQFIQKSIWILAEDFILRHSKIRQRNGIAQRVILIGKLDGGLIEHDALLHAVALGEGTGGNVADDDVFKTVDMYFRGLWNKEKVLNELRYYKMNNQICIVKQQALDCLLTFQKAYEVNSNGK